MFRHFAIITLAITGCIAMFADGEAREAIESQVKERQRQNELLIADARNVGSRTVGLSKAKGSKGVVASALASVDDTDSVESFGAPMDNPVGSNPGGSSGYSPGGPRGPGGSMTGAEPRPGVPTYAYKKGKPVSQPPRPTQAQLEGIMEQSRLRSGAGE